MTDVQQTDDLTDDDFEQQAKEAIAFARASQGKPNALELVLERFLMPMFDDVREELAETRGDLDSVIEHLRDEESQVLELATHMTATLVGVESFIGAVFLEAKWGKENADGMLELDGETCPAAISEKYSELLGLLSETKQRIEEIIAAATEDGDDDDETPDATTTG